MITKFPFFNPSNRIFVVDLISAPAHSQTQGRAPSANQSNVTPNTDYPIGADPRGRSNPGGTSHRTQKFSFKTLFSFKDPKALGDPETDPVALLVIPGGVTPMTFGTSQLTGIFTSLEY